MGGLYGSEYWTYLLPKRVGLQRALRITEDCEPLGVVSAKEIGFIDDHFGDDVSMFKIMVEQKATEIAKTNAFNELLANKKSARAADEAIKPLEDYRKEELQRMWVNFFGDDRAYHVARFQFVHKISCKMPPHKKVAEEARIKLLVFFSRGLRRSIRPMMQLAFGWLANFF
jgi:putative two-component system protein, hydrogenase maturation factor HypX/HoxX